jgi:hypothetical protein
LVLSLYTFQGILPSHEWTRRTVHSFQHRCFFPIFFMDEASTLGRAQRTRYVARIPKGYRTMLANRDHFSYEIRNRLKTTCMGLGLVRLLQDAGRTEEARTTLTSLENGFQGVAEELETPRRKTCKANRMALKGRGPRAALCHACSLTSSL